MTLFASNIKREVCDVLESFLFFKKKLWKEIHHMLLLMLYLKFKSFYLVSSFVGHEECATIVEEYDKKYLYFMF